MPRLPALAAVVAPPILASALLLTSPHNALADPPPIPVTPAFTYQGVLTQSGVPYNGTADLQFSLWDSAGGGFSYSTVPVNGVTVTNGLFTVEVNFGTSEFYGLQRWLQVDVHTPSNGGLGPYTPLTSRQRFAPVPYALHALSIGGVQNNQVMFTNVTNGFAGAELDIDAGTLHVDSANNRVGIGVTAPSHTLMVASPIADAVRLTGPGIFGTNARMNFEDSFGNVYLHNDIDGGMTINTNSNLGGRLALTGGFVGIGTLSPTAGLHVEGPGFPAAFIQTNSNGGNGDSGLRFGRNGTTYWHLFNSSATGDSLDIRTATFGQVLTALQDGKVGIGTTVPTGGRLHVANPGGDGIFAESAVNGGRGVFGYASAGVLSYGVYGQSNGSDGIGVYGTGTTRGGFFTTAAGSGHGVKGNVTGVTGFGSGVFGESAASQGAGVTGYSTATTALSYGGVFQAVSTIGQAVYGYASHTTGQCIGVHGQSASSNPLSYGVFATGRSGATGTKSFRIDHPDDPANKYLMHYSAESPEVINFYSGKVVLNGAGEAVVDMPAYFAKINIDPRYTLTAIGAAMPNLHIAEEISDAMLAAEGPCWFRIAGGAPGGKVSWRVEAVRHDAWVRAYGAPVEIDKPDHERGRYQHPELYGQPASAALNADAAEIFKNHSAPIEPAPDQQ